MLSTRQRLLLLQCGTVLATSLFLGALSYSLFIPTLFKLQKQQLQQISKSSAKDLAYSLTEMTRTLESLDLEGFHQKYGDLPIEELFVKHFAKFSASFPLICYLDEAGNEKVRLVHGRPSEHYFAHNEHSELLKTATSQPNRVHIDVLKESDCHEHASLQLAITRIGYFGDEFLGTLKVTLPLSQLRPYLDTGPLPEGGFLVLLDDRYRVLLSPNEEDQFSQLDQELQSAPARQRFLDQDLFVAKAAIEPFGWQVVAAIPHATFVRDLSNLKLLSVLTCIIVSLLSGILVMRLVRHLTANIHLLIQHTEEVGSGNLEHHLELYQDSEFLQLGTAFNNMTMELARQQSGRETLRQILESIIDPLVVTDRLCNIQQVNHATLELFGCEESQLLGKPLIELFPNPPGILTELGFPTNMLRKRINNLETQVQTLQGKKVTVLFSSSPVPGRNNDIGSVGIIKDIDELMNARIAREHALREAEEAHRKIDALLKSVADGLLVTDLSGRVILHNQPAEVLLGHPQQETFKLVLESLPNPGQMEGTAAPFDISLPARQNSPHRIVQVHSSPVLDHRGSQTGMVSVLRDVTRERALEQIKNEFISTAAHELTTPLTSIVGYSELLLDQELEESFSSDQKRDFMEEILGRSESLSRIVDDLLNISRIESGQPIPINIAPIPIEPLLEKVVAQFQLANKQHHFELHHGKNPQPVLIDSEKIRQVFENLLSNAVKYSPEPTPIIIESRYAASNLILQIQDQGVGMNAEQLERVFDKFYRADASDTSVGGLGLGMSIVKQIVEGHRGEIMLTSQPGEGTCVTLRLPLAGRTEQA